MAGRVGSAQLKKGTLPSPRATQLKISSREKKKSKVISKTPLAPAHFHEKNHVPPGRATTKNENSLEKGIMAYSSVESIQQREEYA
ncbi:MAG: hypothetical protein AB1646_26285, partial [Thermodesulfobacteriota bacterium]